MQGAFLIRFSFALFVLLFLFPCLFSILRMQEYLEKMFTKRNDEMTQLYKLKMRKRGLVTEGETGRFLPSIFPYFSPNLSISLLFN